MSRFVLQVAERGRITLPKALRDIYDIQPGDTLRLIDLGGVFVLSRQPSQVDALADRLASELAAKGESLETMLQALSDERERRVAAHR
jgi:AbrB family looped-hinge helix DNA binding protein